MAKRLSKVRQGELKLVVGKIVAAKIDEAQNEYDNNSNATGSHGSHGNLDKRVGRLLREMKKTFVDPLIFDQEIIDNKNELDYVKKLVAARARKFEASGKEKNHPFRRKN